MSRLKFNDDGVFADKSAFYSAYELMRFGHTDKQKAISLFSAVIEAAQRRISEIEGRKSEPIGIGPGGYDPTKDTDITGV